VRRTLFLSLAVLPLAFACSGDDDEGDPQAFCADLEDAGSGDFLAGLEPTDPATADRVLDELRDLQEVAPPEVEVEVEVLADKFEELAAAFDEGGGDLGNVVEQFDDFEEVQEVQTAAERIERYVRAECDLSGTGS